MIANAFAAWLKRVANLHDELREEVISAAGMEPTRASNNPRTNLYRDVFSESLRAFEWVEELNRRTTAFFARREVRDRCRRLRLEYSQLERRFGEACARSEVRMAITASLADVKSAIDWHRARSFAVTLMRVMSADNWVSGDLVGAFLIGVLEHVYPQWTPTFHKHCLPFTDAEFLGRMAEAGDLVILAGRYNEVFMRCAGLGEWASTLLLLVRYAHAHCDLARYALVARYATMVLANMAEKRSVELRDAAAASARAPWRILRAESERMLGIGAAKYCEMLVEFSYGQLEGGSPSLVQGASPSLTEWGAFRDAAGRHGMPCGDDPLEQLFPDAVDREAAAAYCNRHSLRGLLRGLLGCDYLLRSLLEVNDQAAFKLARTAFFGALRRRVAAFPTAALEQDDTVGPILAVITSRFANS